MYKYTLVFYLFSCIHAYALDSLRVEVIKGRQFIIHKVEQNETLEQIAQRYKTTRSDILKYNEILQHTIREGYRIKIPHFTQTNPQRGRTTETYHRVLPKQTLYSISRMYNTTVTNLKKWNNLKSNLILIGQRLKVRNQPENSYSSRRSSSGAKPGRMKGATHRVVRHETLYSLAREYGVTVDDLIRWNNIGPRGLLAGTRIYVTKPRPMYASATTQKKSKVSPPRSPILKSKKTDAKLKDTPRRPVSSNERPTVVVEPKKRTPQVSSTPIQRSSQNVSETVESGLVELYEGADKSKYLAWHDKASQGSILKIKNLKTNDEVYVRVVGKTNAKNKNVILQLSSLALYRLEITETPAEVEVTYYK